MTPITERIANLSIGYVLLIIAILFVIRLIFGRYKSKLAKSFTELVESLLIAFALVFLVIRPFVLQAFFIPSESMEPTLLVHDRLLVNKFIYRFTDPKHADVIVFKSPPSANEARSNYYDEGLMFAQRIDRKSALFDWNAVAGKVTGVSGDSGEIVIHPTAAYAADYRNIKELCMLGKNDSEARIIPLENFRYGSDNYSLIVKLVGINDKASAEELVGKEARIGEKDYIKRVIGLPGDTIEIKYTGQSEYGEPEFAVYRNDQKLDEPYVMDTPDYSRKKVTVPKDMYYVMGDNRRNSNDSHEWGFLDRRRVVGKAMVIFWPFNRIRVIK